MKLFLSIILILIIALVLGFYLHQPNSSVSIHYGSWSIETSILVAVIAVLIIFFILYFLLRFIHETKLWPERLRLWGRKRKRARMIELTEQGISDLIAGKWRSAEQYFEKSAQFIHLPLINYLGAAYAATQQQALDRRDFYLHEISQKKLVSDFESQLLQAHFFVEAHQWEQAETILTRLYQQNPKHPVVLKLLAKAYRQQQNWYALRPILVSLYKQNKLTEAEYNELMQPTIRGLLQEAGDKKDVESLVATWRQVSPREQSVLFPSYVKQLVQCGQDQQALILIERALKQQWNPALLDSYAKLNTGNIPKQLSQAENWLKKYPNSPELLLCLGYLSLRYQLWGNAKDYLKESLTLRPTVEGYYALAQVEEALNNQVAAIKNYQQGIQLATTVLIKK